MTTYTAYPGHAISNTTIGTAGILDVVNGGLALSDTLVAGGTEYVSSGGLASNTIISGDGQSYVLNGGTETGAMIFGAGTETVSSGGTTSDTRIFGDDGAGGYEYVDAGATASNTSVGLHGVEIIAKGGLDIDATVSAGIQYIYAGGIASSTFVQGSQIVSGGSAYDVTISGGSESVYSGGVAENALVLEGVQYVFSGGTVNGTTIAGGELRMSGGASANDVTVISSQIDNFDGSINDLVVNASAKAYNFGGTITGLTVNSGGLAYNGGDLNYYRGTVAGVTIFGGELNDVSGEAISSLIQFAGDGGLLLLDATGLPSGTISGFAPGDQIAISGISDSTQPTVTVANAGIVTISAAGKAYDLNIAGATVGESSFQVGYADGGTELLLTENATDTANYGAPVNDTVISGSDVLAVNAGGTASSDILVSGGSEYVYSGGIDYGTVIRGGGYEFVASSGAETNGSIAGGILQLNAGGIIAGGVFFGKGGELIIDGNTMPTAKIFGFAPGDSIKLANVSYDSATDSVQVLSAGVVTIDANGQTYNLNIAGATVGESNFVIGGDLLLTENPVCFCAGTRIRTPEGEVAVEALQIGGMVETAFCGAQKIKWIGKRAYNGKFIAGNHLALPVCIKQGALADKIPARDLFVSPGHAIFVDGALIPAWRLINGVSITQAQSVEDVQYFHVELDAHEIIFAEGCATESFFDEFCRNQFQNAMEFLALYPDAQRGVGLRRTEDGFALDTIYTGVASRAGIVQTKVVGTLRGYIDQAGPDFVYGWAQDEAAPEQPVGIEILLDGHKIARVLANRYRPDLREAGLGSGCHAFELYLPGSASGLVEVRRAEDGCKLALAEGARAA